MQSPHSRSENYIHLCNLWSYNVPRTLFSKVPNITGLLLWWQLLQWSQKTERRREAISKEDESNAKLNSYRVCSNVVKQDLQNSNGMNELIEIDLNSFSCQNLHLFTITETINLVNLVLICKLSTRRCLCNLLSFEIWLTRHYLLKYVGCKWIFFQFTSDMLTSLKYLLNYANLCIRRVTWFNVSHD